MKILLDTNIILHREGKNPSNPEIGKLFNWIDRLGFKKCIHQITLNEITKMQDKKVRESFLVKLESYHYLPTSAPLHRDVKKVSEEFDTNENDFSDTTLLNEVFVGRIDFLLTEDKKIHKKAIDLEISDKVFSIHDFIEKVTSENPELMDYDVLPVKREFFGNINLNDDFFNSLKEDYPLFEDWFNKKSDELAYVCYSDKKLVAFLYLKIENDNEVYTDIKPVFSKKKRLKVGTFKVELNGFKLGERFLKIIFDNALRLSVDEIYVTVFPKRLDQVRLIDLLKDFGFQLYGEKKSNCGTEDVLVRGCSPSISINSPKTTYPFLSGKTGKYIVPIHPKYHTNLLPDSILSNESPLDFNDNVPVKNAISKVYISRSFFRNLKSGDIIIFYRTGGYYHGVITTLGIVEKVHTGIKSLDDFINLCRNRSVFSPEELESRWEENPNSRPFIVKFLYVYSFPKRINLQQLIQHDIIPSAPRGFEPISNSSFEKIISETGTNGHIIID